MLRLNRLNRLKRDLARADQGLRIQRGVVNARYQDVVERGLAPLRLPIALPASFAAGLGAGWIAPRTPVVRKTGGILASELITLAVKLLLLPEISWAVGKMLNRSE